MGATRAPRGAGRGPRRGLGVSGLPKQPCDQSMAGLLDPAPDAHGVTESRHVEAPASGEHAERGKAKEAPRDALVNVEIRDAVQGRRIEVKEKLAPAGVDELVREDVLRGGDAAPNVDASEGNVHEEEGPQRDVPWARVTYAIEGQGKGWPAPQEEGSDEDH